MDFEDFRKDFMEEIKADAAASGIGSVASFVNTASAYMLNADVFPDAITPAYFEGEGKRNRKLRVDGYLFDTADNTMNLFIADYDAIDRDPPMTKSLAQGFFNKLIYFVEEALGKSLQREIEPSSPAADLIDDLVAKKESTNKYKLVILTTRDMGERAIKWEPEPFENIPVEYQIWDISRIFRVYSSNLGRQNIEIDFTSYMSNGLPYIEATGMEDNGFKSYLCIMPGSALAQIYDDIGSQLLEGNVRSFLSTKVAVNKKIRQTILNEPSKFFAYNNGISATAMNLKFERNAEGFFITYAEDFQIINGGQTTASLSNARRKDKADLSDIYVQMKLTEIDSGSDQAAELIRNISKSSNSQSKVSDADFFSTHAFHIRMEQISRRLFAPAVDGNQYETHWFYERARGQYVQLQMAFTKAEIEKFKKQNPKEQRVTKTDLAKFRNSWDCYPHIVSKGADASFSFFAEIIDAAWEKNSDAFNDKYFKDSMALAKLFKEIEVLVTNQPWYDKGYRANIVTYSIAIFKHLLNKLAPKKNFDLSVIWNRQKVPAEVINEFKKITFFVKEQITDPSRGTANVTQWCKRENCWEKMKAAAEEEFDLLTIDNIDDYLLSADEEKSQVRQAKSAQKDISEAEAQAAVWEMGAPFWMQIEKFVLEKRLGSPEMRKALWPATRAKLPSPYQAKRLLELLELAKEEGFKAVEENGEY